MGIQERTLEKQKKLVEGIGKRDQKRRKRIEAAGIDYECPEIVRSYSMFVCLFVRFFFFFLTHIAKSLLTNKEAISGENK